MWFIISKALAFLPFGNLLRGASGKLILGLVIVGALAFAYWKWKDNIREEIFNQINQETAEQLIRNQEEQLRRQEEFLDRQGKLAEELLRRQRQHIENSNQISNIIDNVTPEDNGPVAPILDKVFKQINAFEGYSENVTPSSEATNKVETEEEPSTLDKAVEVIESTGNSAIDQWRKLTNGKED